MNIFKKRLFLVVSLFLLMADISFVVFNWQQDQQQLQLNLEEEGVRLQTSFEIAQQLTYTNMLQLATFVAEEPEVRQLFAAGVKAVEQEGGGAGGVQAAIYRQALFDTVSASWQRMTREYYVRQLHFHMGPGSVSFLRVHKPAKFGDNMDKLRHMVVDVNKNHQARTGLELGRVYSGLRGIVPVLNPDGQPVGALEAGTSYRATIDLLSETIKADIAVLFNESRVTDATWSRPEDAVVTQCGCFVEASSSSELASLLPMLDFTPYRSGAQAFEPITEQVDFNGTLYAVTHFGIRDYIGQRDHASVPVGRVLIWHSAQSLKQAVVEATYRNIWVAAVSYLLIECLLFVALRYFQQHLQQQIAHRTREVQNLNHKLQEQANRDALTGLYNRRALMEHLARELNRASRNAAPVSLVMFDLDHFKQVNDVYGHVMGDRVLQSVGEVTQGCCRNYDIAARYGGEEFCVVLPDTRLEYAVLMAEKLRLLFVEKLHFSSPAGALAVTASLGVASVEGQSQNAEALLAAADTALYEAKRKGRNRVEYQQE